MNNISLKDNIAEPYYCLFNEEAMEQYKYIFLTGGRNTLKSSTASIWERYDMLNNPNTHSLYMRKVKDTLHGSVYTQCVWATNLLGMDSYCGDNFPAKQTSTIIYEPTGQQALFRGADDPSKIKSIKTPFGYIKRIIFEEFDQFNNEEDFNVVIESVLRGIESGNFKFIFIMNPPQDKNHWANKYVRKMKLRPDVLHIHTDYRQMPVKFISKDFIEEAEWNRKTNYTYYEWKYLGIPNATTGGDSMINYDLFTHLKQLDDYSYLHTTKGALGVDVARFGDDKTSIKGRVGADATIYNKKYSKQDTMETTGQVVKAVEYLDMNYNLDEIDINIDDTGVGGGVTDRLNELKETNQLLKKCNINPVNNGESIKHDETAGKEGKKLKDILSNVGTELWYSLGQKLEQNKRAIEGGGKPTIAIPIDNELFEEASARKRKYTSNGKMRVEPKDQYKKRMGKSPDDTDALTLCFYEPPKKDEVWLI